MFFHKTGHFWQYFGKLLGSPKSISTIFGQKHPLFSILAKLLKFLLFPVFLVRRIINGASNKYIDSKMGPPRRKPRPRGNIMDKGKQSMNSGLGPLIIKIGGRPMRPKIDER